MSSVLQHVCDLLSIYEPPALPTVIRTHLSYYKVRCSCLEFDRERPATLDPCALQQCTCLGRCQRCGGRVLR